MCVHTYVQTYSVPSKSMHIIKGIKLVQPVEYTQTHNCVNKENMYMYKHKRTCRNVAL